MTWVTTTDVLPRETPAGAALEPSAQVGSGAATLPRALWTEEEPGWDEQRVLVVEPSHLRALGTAAAMEGYLWIPLEPPRPSHRGKLALHIEECIESALQARGAPPPGVGASADLDASLGDQLYRARLVEMRGVALGVPDLGGIANLGGVLDAEDSAALRWWAAAARDRPVRVVLSSENHAYRIYPSPVAFGALLEAQRGSFSDAPSPRAPSAETAQSVAAMELSDLPPSVAAVEPEEAARRLADDVELPELDRALGLEAAEPAPDAESDSAVAPSNAPEETNEALREAAPSEELSEEREETSQNSVVAENPPCETSAAEEPNVSADVPAADAVVAAAPTDESESAVLEALSSPAAPPVSPVVAATQPARPVIKSSISMDAARRTSGSRVPFVVSADDADAFDTLGGSDRGSDGTRVAPESRDADAQAEPAQAEAVVAPETPAAEDPFEAYAREHWKTWMRELDAARGPKPLALVERLFVTAYTRLDAALERGIADESARGALETWRASFSKSYSEAFDALRVRGKRPNMVLDVPELAQRVGRLHGARRVQLLLVDGMRFDLGMLVQDRLKLRGDASLTERMLLWSALPTTTTQQLELLGKGADGLKDMAQIEEEAPAVVARGRAAHTLRRIRTGRRELFKLDVVEAALREGPADGDLRTLRERMPSIADDVATAVGDFFTKQAPRTLVVVFGDHGFRCDDEAPLGQEASQGGASPEEVLVPAFAWLTGATH